MNVALTSRRGFVGRAGATLAALAGASVATGALAETELPPSPDERISAAVAEIKAALAEKYPDSHISERVRLHPGSAGVAVGASPHQDFQVSYHFRDGAPLLPEDAGRWQGNWRERL